MIVRQRSNIALISILTLVGTLYGSTAFADVALGTEGNVRLINPYPDPADSYFGFGIATGDFNGDGIDDIVISELGTPARFRVLLGKPYAIGGPYPTARFISKTVATPKYGSILATGDFNGDGVDEIAIGDRFSYSNPGGGGVVYIYRRSALDDWTVQTLIRQGISGYNGIDEDDDKFGFSLASGDFDGDGYDDLAIGLPGQSQAGSPSIPVAGAVQVVYGSASGLTGTRDRVFTAANDGLGIAADSSDQYGYALAAGDIDGDGDDDLAIGVPRRGCPNGGQRAGGVVILKGSTSLGLSTIGAQAFQPGQDGVLGDCDSPGSFGSALSIGQLDGTIYRGLAIGAPLADVGGIDRVGAIHLLYGTASGLTTANNNFISVANLPGGVVTPLMQFGVQVKLGRLRRGTQSIAISSSNETVNGIENAGVAWVLHSNSGFVIAPSLTVERWTESRNLRIGPPISGDRFGASLAIGDFNGDHKNDLVVGAYQYEMNGAKNAGAAQVIYESEFIFTDGFDR